MLMKPGFTLVEMLMVMGIMLLLVGLTAAISGRSIRSSEFDRVRDTIRGELFAAQADTMAGTRDSAWGVAFFPNSITRYKGDSFITRDPVFDLVTDFQNQVIISGTVDVAFTRPFGQVSAPAQITIADNELNISSVITVNQSGAIEIN
ncbi:MAG TPA: prepilin-type N-terminal cleavage/methylation domain-containing protein [bacterium]|mgnify:CR=1 FL=1|nr:MAG: hypothetical protein BWY14_00136 [Parcubacteria group bacterium ADurb.Bin192]HPN15146.1 prepilin-type N-terminal cleavage/methylation domain-containing protein [bacterium]